jgi:biotin synthase
MAKTIQQCVDLGILPALFAFTPIAGTALENTSQPSIETYRRVQVARHLMANGIVRFEDMQFDEEGRIVNLGIDNHTLLSIAQKSDVFLTSGCPDCNRPYYNEKPSGPIYNYPKHLSEKELAQIQQELGLEGA